MKNIFDYVSLTTPQGFSAHLIGMASLKVSVQAAEPTTTHHLLPAMHDRGNLLRWYSQNIDSLELRTAQESVGEKYVALHGSLDLVWCPKCFTTQPWLDQHTKDFQQGLAASCVSCDQPSTSGSKDNVLSAYELHIDRLNQPVRRARVGYIMPCIYLYNMPVHKWQGIIDRDMNADCKAGPDVTLVMGTSLAIPGIQGFLGQLKSSGTGCKFLYVNRERPTHGQNETFDYHVQGEVSDWTSILFSALNLQPHKTIIIEKEMSGEGPSALPGDNTSRCGSDAETRKWRESSSL